MVTFVIPYYQLYKKHTIVRHDGSKVPLNMPEHFCALVYASCFNILQALLSLPLHSFGWIMTACNIACLIFPLILYRQLYNISWAASIWRFIVSWAMVIVIIFTTVPLVFGIFYGFDAISN